MRLGFICNKTPGDLQLAEQIGFTNVELFFSVRGEDPVDFPEREDFMGALNDSPITVSAVALHNDEFPISEEPRLRQISDERFKQALEIACEVDASVLFTGSGLHPTRDMDELADRVLSVFPQRAAQAEQSGRRLAFISCKTANEVNRPALWERVLPKLPSVGIKYDPSHGAYDGRDYLVELEAWALRVLHAHAKDVMRIGDRFHADPNPGFGQIQWGPIFALLYEVDYAGAVVVEPHSGLWTQSRREAGLRASYRFLSQFLLD